MKHVTIPVLASLALFAGAAVHAATVNVDGQDDIYNSNGVTAYDGLNAVAIDVTGVSYLTFAVSSLATISLNSMQNFSSGDGGSFTTSYNSGSSQLSEITASTAGFLTGAFFGSSTVATPNGLNFTASGVNFASLAPQVQQTFFIGDGLTGENAGTTQIFYVPTGATTLYLGISDACGFHGSPGCYGDNSGSLTVNATTFTTVSAVPEPDSYAMLLAGLGVAGVICKRKRAKVV